MNSNIRAYSIVLWVLLSSSFVWSDTIQVHNKITPIEASELMGVESDGMLYARIYYYKEVDEYLISKDAQGRMQPIVAIPSQSSQSIERPDRWRYQLYPYPKNFDRQLVFSFNKEDLKDNLSNIEYQKLGAVNIGNAKGWDFYIVERDFNVEGYNAAEWHIIKPLRETKEKAENMIKQLIKKTFLTSVPNAHEFEQAFVRKGNELNEGERAFLAQRTPIVQETLKKIAGKSIAARVTPTIALVASGGGYRAMLGTVGSLVGAQETELLDAITYMIGLSGSTWALGSLVTRNVTPVQLKETLIALIKNNITDINTEEARLISEALLLKYAYSQNLTIVDIYGALLATRLLGDYQKNRHQVYLSQQIDSIKDAHMPFPLYSAVRRGVGVKSTWWEFTPYEIGSAAFGMYIPSWAYGRKFYAGKSLDFAPEQSLGYNLGTFGSAFAAEFKIIYSELVSSIDEPYKGVIEQITHFIDTKMSQGALTKFSDKRTKYSWATVHNFMAGMPESPLRYEKEIRLVDGGIDFNLPYPLVSNKNKHRKADIIILLDYSGNISDLSALKGCEKYAQDNGLLFPPIDYTDITTRAITVFKDDTNLAVPIIMYMPLVKDQAVWQKQKADPAYAAFVPLLDSFDPVTCEQAGFCKTQNFAYQADQSVRLTGQTEFNFKASASIIKKVIVDWVDSHEKKIDK
ncbi:MAG: hypothetical protein NT124_02340 [Candidatus Dependentiae bacterium]|nr:hypothetical protein [Candidatus Dependentiae bacterium]